MRSAPLSVPLSHLLVAFTIELDNEFERQMAEVGPYRPFRVSIVMWSNFLRFVGSGITVGELPEAAGLPKRRVLSTLGGMERWRYVFVAPPGARAMPTTNRDGFGSARGLKSEWLVRPTTVGVVAQELWPPLFGVIEERWSARFGAGEVAELRQSLAAVVECSESPLPEYLPIVTGANGMLSEVETGSARQADHLPLSALLAKALLAYTLEVERDAPLSLPLAENVVHALRVNEVDVGELPRAAAISPEAVSMSLRYLTKQGYTTGDTRLRLTGTGRAAVEATLATHARVRRTWEKRDRASLARLRSAMQTLLTQRAGNRARLALGLEPPAEGWRASGRYLAQTEAMLADPFSGLPRHPMVLHRGGWPDGS